MDKETIQGKNKISDLKFDAHLKRKSRRCRCFDIEAMFSPPVHYTFNLL